MDSTSNQKDEYNYSGQQALFEIMRILLTDYVFSKIQWERLQIANVLCFKFKKNDVPATNKNKHIPLGGVVFDELKKTPVRVRIATATVVIAHRLENAILQSS